MTLSIAGRYKRLRRNDSLMTLVVLDEVVDVTRTLC